jgi:hypothetical protein
VRPIVDKRRFGCRSSSCAQRSRRSRRDMSMPPVNVGLKRYLLQTLAFHVDARSEGTASKLG